MYAPPNPPGSFKGDAQTIAGFLKTIKGAIVLVGHSYGGAVVTNAAGVIGNVKPPVYVDAFARWKSLVPSLIACAIGQRPKLSS